MQLQSGLSWCTQCGLGRQNKTPLAKSFRNCPAIRCLAGCEINSQQPSMGLSMQPLDVPVTFVA